MTMKATVLKEYKLSVQQYLIEKFYQKPVSAYFESEI